MNLYSFNSHDTTVGSKIAAKRRLESARTRAKIKEARQAITGLRLQDEGGDPDEAVRRYQDELDRRFP